ncbi:MAG: AAA family ATPase [Planctomycetaceae bacterium]|nr:AAA family ATPase [Planctomycetaceae bacterium]MCB9949770.1 AAA family ATPase [Planctomycetaceae bacterium]
MSTFERIHIQGFRRLVDVNLPLKPLNVLIGANGCGKTSLLDVFSLLGASVQGELASAFGDFGGASTLASNLSSHPKIDRIGFSLLFSPGYGKRTLRYGLEVRCIFTSYQVSNEFLEVLTSSGDVEEDIIRRDLEKVSSLKYDSDGNPTRSVSTLPHGSVSPLESAFAGPSADLTRYEEWGDSDIPKKRDAAIQSLKYSIMTDSLGHSLWGQGKYGVIDVNGNSPIRMPQQLKTVNSPGTNGEHLASCLYGMRENQPDDFEAVQAALRAGFPNFERLGFPPVAAGLLAMTWKDKTSKEPFYMHQLSEGTLRFLWLVTLLYSPGLPALTMIDEPEVSLHPELLAILAELFREASQRTQLIVATHSDRLVRHLKPDEVVAMNMLDTGAVEMVRGSELDLDEWLKDYSMDELWSMGILGGRAQ